MGTGIDNTLLLRTKFVETDTGVLTRNGLLYLQSIPGASAMADLQLLGNLDDSFTAASLARSQPKILSGTHAARLASFPAAAFPVGTIFFETDRATIFYQCRLVSAVNQWVYAGGVIQGAFGGSGGPVRPTDLGVNDFGAFYAASDWNGSLWVWSGTVWLYVSANLGGYLRTQAQLAALAALLTANDVNFLVTVTDYAHRLQWSGTGWAWALGEDGSGELRLFEVDPTGTGWHLYDGSTVSYLKSDGTLGSAPLPDLTSIAANAAFTVAGSPNGGPNAAVKTTLTTTTGSVLAGAGASSTFLTSVVTNVEGTPRDIVRRPWFRQ